MTWNIRIVGEIKEYFDGNRNIKVVVYTLRETYYNADGKPTAISSELATPFAENVEEPEARSSINDYIFKMERAARKGVLYFHKNKLTEKKPRAFSINQL